LLDAAIPLGETHGATLVGVHVIPAVVVYADATVSMSTEFIVAQQEAFQEDARAAEAAFRARLEASGLAHEWSSCDTGEERAIRAAATSCNASDLVVASQYHDSIPAASGYSPDGLVLDTGRPVLVVPTEGHVAPLGKRVLAAWNGSREAARALFDCLPLLQPDAELRILVVDSARGNATLTAISRALARHGLNPLPVSVSRSSGRVAAEEILSDAADWRADLLALGCYGHSRLRETVFGGATKRILRDMRLPVLMAH